MKLFIKHIFRSIKKSPLQPLIILLTLTVSVAMFITSVKIAFNIYKENLYHKNLDTYISDITVKPSQGKDMRIVSDKDVREIVGDGGEVLGELNLTAMINKNGISEIVNICAADFVAADNFYDLRFSEYGKITEEKLNSTIIISTKAAKSYNVGIGDTISLYFFNYRFDMTVQAIALPDGVLKNSKGIINIGAVTGAIAATNPALAAGLINNPPYTEVKVKINDKAEIDEYASRISAALEDKTVIKAGENSGAADFASLLSMTLISLVILIVLIISGVVIATCLDLLNKKRIQESALFMISGAEEKDLNRILYLECFVYSGVAAILGQLLSLWFYDIVNSLFEWNTTIIKFEPYDILIAVIASPLIVFMTALFHTQKSKSASVSERMSGQFNLNAKYISKTKLVLLLLLAAALFTLSHLIPPELRFYGALLTLFVLVAVIYCVLPYIITVLAEILVSIAKRFKRIPPKAILAFNNIRSSHSLKHTARLITVLLTLLFTIIPCLTTLTQQCGIIENAVNCDYVSIKSDEEAGSAVKKLDGVENAFRMGLVMNIVHETGAALLGISMESTASDTVNPEIAPKKLPQNNEIVISSGLSILTGKEAGDRLTLLYETRKYEFEIIEVIKTGTNIVFLDISYLGGKNDILCINTSDSLSDEERTNIANELELRSATMLHKNSVFLPLTNRILSFANLMLFVIILTVFTTSFGILNVLFSAGIYRRDEKRIYYTTGMTKGQIFACEAIEIFTMILFAMALLPVLSFAARYLVDISINSFGIDLFY